MGHQVSEVMVSEVSVSALVSGLILDYIWSQGTLIGIHVDMEVHGMISSNVKTVTAIVLIAILSLAFLGACGKQQDAKADSTTNVEAAASVEETAKKAANTPEAEERTGDATTVNLTIGGMHSENCQKTLTRALGQCPGVTSAVVDLGSEKAEVKGVGIDPQALVTAVAKRGYTAEVIK